MLAALMFALGFLAGAMLPRDIHPMRQLSAFLMRNSRNDRLAFATFIFAAAVVAAALLFSR